MVNKTITISLYITIEQLKYITLIYITHTLGTSLVAQMVKNWLAMWETWVQFNPWVGKIPWRREWLHTPVLWPGEFHGQRSLAATEHGFVKSQPHLVHWEDLEGSGGEGGEKGDRDGEHM